MGNHIVTPEFRLSFAHIFTPEERNGKVRYAISMIFPPTADLKPLENLIKQAVLEKFPDPSKAPKGMRHPIRDGNEVTWEGYAGNKFASARNQDPPGIVDQRRQPILDPKKVYSGCWCRAAIETFYYDREGNKGVALSLKHIQFVRDDTPFSGRAKAEDVFSNVDAPATALAGDEFFA
jgi:hypothetical protein